MSELLSDKSLPAALTQAADLPSLPAVAVEVLRLCRDEETTLDHLADVLARDPALAARLLRFANSSLSNLGHEVATLQRATLVLGMKTVQLMALSFSLAESLPHRGSNAFDYQEYWRRSLATAVAARTIAGVVGSMMEDEAFLCGLLAEIGQVVLVQVMEQDYHEVLARAGRTWPTCELENEVLGFDHCDVGHAFLRSWEMPAVVYLGVAAMRRPETLPASASPEMHAIARIMCLAGLTVDLLTAGSKGEALARIEDKAHEYFDLDAATVYAFVTSLDAGIREASKLLDLPPPSGNTHQQILSEARKQLVELGVAGTAGAGDVRGQVVDLEHRRTIPSDPALRDGLSGIPGREAFDRFLSGEIRSRLVGVLARPLGVLCIGVDGLDPRSQWGAEHRDAWAQVARTLESLVRRGDIAADLGDHHFALIMSEGSPIALKVLAERLRSGVEEAGVRVPGGEATCTVSIGGACLGAVVTESDGLALLDVATRYRRKAQAAGANRSELHASVLSLRR